MRNIDQIGERLSYLGNRSEADIQWLLSKLEKAERAMVKALPHINNQEALAAINNALYDIKN